MPPTHDDQIQNVADSNIELPPLLQETNNTYHRTDRNLQNRKISTNNYESSSDPIVSCSQIKESIYARQIEKPKESTENWPQLVSKEIKIVSQTQQSHENHTQQRDQTSPKNQRDHNLQSTTRCTENYAQQQQQHHRRAMEERQTSDQRHAARSTILQARDLLVQAYTLTPDRGEQAQILDLLEIFREYTERGILKKASSIIASQVANLETAARQIETKAKSLTKAVTPALPFLNQSQKNNRQQQAQQQVQSQTQTQTLGQSQPQPLQSHPKHTSMAAIAAHGSLQSSSPLEWTVVGKKQSQNTNNQNQPSAKKPKLTRRVILIQRLESSTKIQPLAARNTINNAFALRGIKGPVVNVVAKTNNNNIAITMTEDYSADFFLEKKDIWEKIIPHISVQKDEPWFKVVAHGIPIADFKDEHGMEMIKSEVVIFNKGLKPIGMPHWISTRESRQVKLAGSVAIAFATEAEANRAIRNRLYIAGTSVRVTKFFTVAPTTQCTNCLAFGHLDSYCRKEPKCSLCGEQHSTHQHYCSACKCKGKSCSHLQPKCVNCTGNHPATSKTCETFKSLLKRTDEIEL